MSTCECQTPTNCKSLGSCQRFSKKETPLCFCDDCGELLPECTSYGYELVCSKCEEVAVGGEF